MPSKTIASLFLLLSSSTAFTTPQTKTRHTQLHSTKTPDVVIISPPGGIGEITSIETARTGSSVKWFVITDSAAPSSSLSLTTESMDAIKNSGGSIEFAKATAESLYDDSTVVAAWCGGAKAVVCTYDGVNEEVRRVDRALGEEDNGQDRINVIKSGIRVAAREAVGVANKSVVKVVALDSGDEMEEEGGKKGFLEMFQKGKGVPSTLDEAMEGEVTVVRYGELFGAPESSPESSPFVGGPRIEPILRDMYTMRSIRIDPTISVSGNILSGGSKSNRLSISSSLTRLATNQINIPPGTDIALSSYPGSEPTEAEWNTEFSRAIQMISSPSGGATLFSAEFKVSSTTRLAEWLSTKWAPAILRSYDIAGIRVGARPVYATQNENVVEVVWQELVEFNSVTSGKMIITVNEDGMVATRGAGDASAGFGRVSIKPLAGEDILVRRLADAAAQAVEKGLALKPKEKSKPIVATKETVVEKPPAVMEMPKSAEQQQQQSPAADAGPRSSGVRRSSERARGRKRKEANSTGSFE